MNPSQELMLSLVNRVMSVALYTEAAIGALLPMLVPEQADWCTIDLLDTEGVAQTAHARPLGAAAPAELVRRALVSGQPVVEGARARRVVSLPLIARGAVIGAISLGAPRLGLDTLEQIAIRLALSFDEERRRTQAETQAQRRQQQLAIVSHELKNPLTAIDLQTELLLARKPAPDLRRDIEAIRMAASRMNRLVNDLLVVDKLEARRLTLTRRAISAKTLVREATEGMRLQAEKKPVTLVLSLPDEDRILNVDSQRLAQVMENLLGNALKFTPKGGRVSVTLLLSSHSASVIVRDTGVGIPAEHLPHVFDRYWQGRNTAHLGSGLGLYISKNIVELHGGQIEVESRVGEGTTVRLTLPYDLRQSSSEPVPQGSRTRRS